jgi:uncharacterized protein
MDFEDVFGKMDDIIADYSMPRRVKTVMTKVKSDLSKDIKNKDVMITTSIYALDEASNDVNMPMHVKTVIWDIISELEALK